MDLLQEKSTKGLGAAEKNPKKVKAICTSFSLLNSQSGKSKIQLLTTLCRSLILPVHGLSKSLRLFQVNLKDEIFLKSRVH